MTLHGVKTVILRYFTEFGKPVFQHVTASICGGLYARVSSIMYCLYDVVTRHKVSSRSLSHLLMSFLCNLACSNDRTMSPPNSVLIGPRPFQNTYVVLGAPPKNRRKSCSKS